MIRFPLPILLQNGERVRVRGGHLLCGENLSPTLSPRKRGEGEERIT